MTDQACQFGENGRLVGVVSQPEVREQPELALVLVSAGFTARVGPHRLYTGLARRVAGLGITVLRFDLGGIGNSQILHPGVSLQDRTKQDIRDALDYLEATHGIRRFILGGLCSGAEDSFRYAEIDDRVAGVVLIDPHAFQTKWSRVRRYLSRNFVNRIIYKLLRVFGIVKIAGGGPTQLEVEGFEGELIDYRYMEHAEAERIVKELIRRNVRMQYIYTAGRIKVFNHRRQFFSMFRGVEFRDLLTVDFIPTIQHVQVFEEDRNKLICVISKHLDESYLAGTAPV